MTKLGDLPNELIGAEQVLRSNSVMNFRMKNIPNMSVYFLFK